MKTGKLIACTRDGSSRQVEVMLTKENIVISDIEIPIDTSDKTSSTSEQFQETCTVVIFISNQACSSFSEIVEFKKCTCFRMK